MHTGKHGERPLDGTGAFASRHEAQLRAFFCGSTAGLHLTRFTCLTCCKRFIVCVLVVFVGVWCLWFFCLVCLLGGFVFGFVSCFPLLLARLSSFSDWCQIAVSREKKHSTCSRGDDVHRKSQRSMKNTRIRMRNTRAKMRAKEWWLRWWRWHWEGCFVQECELQLTAWTLIQNHIGIVLAVCPTTSYCFYLYF